MTDLFGIRICKRSIENSLEEAATKATPVYHQIMRIIKKGAWVGSDEIGSRVQGRRWWQWTWQNELGRYGAVAKQSKKRTGSDFFVKIR